MVQDTIRHGLVTVVLSVEGLADHMKMSLLPHLLLGEHPKLDVTSDRTRRREGGREEGEMESNSTMNGTREKYRESLEKGDRK